MSTIEMIIFGIVMLHLLVGFGYVLYKLNVKPKRQSSDEKQPDEGHKESVPGFNRN